MNLRASAGPAARACVLRRADKLLPLSAPRGLLGLCSQEPCPAAQGLTQRRVLEGTAAGELLGQLSRSVRSRGGRELTLPLSSEQHNRFVLDCKDKEPDVLFVGDSMVQLLQQYEVPRRGGRGRGAALSGSVAGDAV